MSGRLTIRVGGPEDVAAAAEVWRTATAARRGVPDVAPEEARVSRARIAGDGWFLVAEEHGRVVAMASGTDGRADDGAGPVIPGLCHISYVYVSPDRWGRGVGATILDAALEEARRRGYTRVQLWTQETNERAQRLYRSRGFAPTGRTMTHEGELIGHWAREL